MRKISTLLAVVLYTVTLTAQNEKIQIRNIFDQALKSDVAYNQLKWLCENTAGRICGSPEAATAVEYMRQEMLKMNLDTVYLQSCMVKNWKRGEPEKAYILSKKMGRIEVPVSALGLSIGTGNDGLGAKIVEVSSFKELELLGKNKIEGKIVFFNKPMDPILINTFSAYGGAAGLRTGGAAEAAKYGAIGVVVRSLTLASDDHPHTGVMQYQNGIKKIPAIMISTKAADLLSSYIGQENDLGFYFRTTCQTLPDVPSNNVIGEIRGSKYPDKIITIGGHLDAWDTGQGAHDDGGGCVQSIEVLRLFTELGIKPNFTIRAVMFMDEEVAQRGGQKYAELADQNQENHVMAIELDRGVLVPRAVAFSSLDQNNTNHQKIAELFKPYNINIVKGGGGVDIGPLKQYYPSIIFGDLVTDDQRYFDFHHSENDRFEQVNKRELQLGAATIASFIYLMDHLGVE
ncbi:MAG: peptidase M28 family protein [Bacteroidetes bacterium HGW-Bacteroidetes-17]|nr:MAG: peptidase M28 family protein [Bacteroidetes bacterium HGW-Bacteroidetes-17]